MPKDTAAGRGDAYGIREATGTYEFVGHLIFCVTMRWFWIDRFTEFERGRRAVSIKTVSMAEEQLDDYSPGFAFMPASLIIEGMAQTAGLLIGEMEGFSQRV